MEVLFENVDMDDILSFLRELRIILKKFNVNMIIITQSDH